jgi:outer membrane protein, heavy metal efflux system
MRQHSFIGTPFALRGVSSCEKKDEHLRPTKLHLWVTLNCALLLHLGGCATAKEERSFADYERLKEEFVGSSGDAKNAESTKLPILTGNPDMGKYLAYAAANSPELRGAFAIWKSRLERIPQVRALPNPQLRYSYFIRSVETRAGPQRNRFGLSQAIPWPQKLSLNGHVAFQHSEAARRRFDEARRELFFRVKLAYFDLYFLKRSIDITNQTIVLARYYERIALVRYRTSGGKHPDVIRAQLELGRLEERSKSLNDMRGPRNASVNAALNRPSDAPVDWPKTLETDPLWPADELLIARLGKSNFELLALSAEIERENKAIERAHKEYYPDFTFGVDYIDTASAIRSGTPDSSNDPVILNFGISLPLWTSKYSAGVREASARKQSIRYRQRALLRSLEARLQSALFNLRDSKRKIDLYKNTLIPKAEQAQRATVTSFEAGKSDFLSLIDVERTLLEFLLNYERALTDQARSNALIERLIGAELEKK